MSNLDPSVCAYHVIATAMDEKKPHNAPRLRPISRRFSVKAAAEDFCALAKAEYPDAYVAAVPVRERKADKGRYA